MSARTRDASLPVQQVADDGRVLRDEFVPNRDWDCEDYWLALGSTIQVAKTTMEEMTSRDPDPKWTVDDMDAFLESVWGNYKDGLDTLRDNGCATQNKVYDLDRQLSVAWEEIRSPRHAAKILGDLEDAWYDAAPGQVHQRLQESNRPTEDSGGSRTTGTGGVQMRCETGQSVEELQADLNEHLAQGDPEGMSMARDEDVDLFYGCVILSNIADERGR